MPYRYQWQSLQFYKHRPTSWFFSSHPNYHFLVHADKWFRYILTGLGHRGTPLCSPYGNRDRWPTPVFHPMANPTAIVLNFWQKPKWRHHRLFLWPLAGLRYLMMATTTFCKHLLLPVLFAGRNRYSILWCVALFYLTCVRHQFLFSHGWNLLFLPLK